MAITAQTATLSLKTLRGVFEQPKMNHRRNFLRENKLSLRELQKNTSHKLTQQKQERESRQYKHLQRSHDQTLARRSASHSRNVEQVSKTQTKVKAETDDTRGVTNGNRSTNGALTEKSGNLASKRSYSLQRHDVKNLENATCCCIQQKLEREETKYRKHIPRTGSSVSLLSKAESCDKEIQTEDIHDEDFLYQALKKCSSSEIHKFNTTTSNQQHSNYNLQQYEPELNSVHSRQRAANVTQYHYEDNKSQHDQLLQHTPRYQNTCTSNGRYDTQEDEIIEDDSVNRDLEHNVRNLKISADMRREPEPQSSARSRQTLCSTSTKRSVHKLGSREDVRLPRYLEKEKREKEEERMRELSKDFNCPVGHYALSEEERIESLSRAQQQMALLINELNHMPMTMETLRIRNRKVEIEKELSQIECNIRLYSKPKVYIPKKSVQY